jgi:hypothetical protein
VCLGHYAQKGFVSPLSGKKNSKYLTIEVTDYATLRMNRSRVLLSVLEYILPHPIRFKQVWHFSRGDKSMYSWKPIAPDHFVALGMVCTDTDEPPSLSSIRCVPALWCRPATYAPVKIWDDTGAGGGRPGSAWIINSFNMIAVVPGHTKPTETFYDLNSNRFFIDGSHLPPK